MKNIRIGILHLALIIGLSALLCGCADYMPPPATKELVGFWYGLWHGLIAPYAWIVSWFDSTVTIYAQYNNGGWYNFGYLLGIGALTSSGTKASSS